MIAWIFRGVVMWLVMKGARQVLGMDNKDDDGADRAGRKRGRRTRRAVTEA